MQNSRTHHFYDADNNHTVVITGLLPWGEWGAYRLDEEERGIRGYGPDRFTAIADLQEQIDDE